MKLVKDSLLYNTVIYHLHYSLRSQFNPGTSGVFVFRIGSSCHHVVAAWSGPRNFYAHSNTLAVGISNGLPRVVEEGGGYAALFNKMYSQEEGTY